MRIKKVRQRWEAVETCVCFNFVNLLRNVRRDVQKRISRGTEGDRYRQEILNNLLKFEINGQRFTYATAKNKLGGVRWFVNCPKCGRKKMKLYLPTRFPDREQLYQCSACHRLKVTSYLRGKSYKYKSFIRPLRRMQKIKDALLNKRCPKDKAQELLAEYESLERVLKNTPEYRLWRFKVEHGGLE
jgi:hypothetical protein